METKVAEKQLKASGKAASKAEQQLEEFRAKRELAESKMEETMAKIGARPEPSAPPPPSQEVESPETKEVGYMQDDVDAWTKTKTGL